jgi:hypothetical protein
MSRIYILSCCVLGFALAGCGPMQAPLPARLDDESQKSINESWDKALTPVDHLNHQSLLDALLTTGAYQHGVDKLEFRSEKNFSGGVVVMEIHFERAAPERDQFTVTVQDQQGKVLRKEQYDRTQIETACREMSVELDQLRKKRDAGNASAEELRKLEGYEARFAVVESVFPNASKKRELENAQQPKK